MHSGCYAVAVAVAGGQEGLRGHMEPRSRTSGQDILSGRAMVFSPLYSQAWRASGAGAHSEGGGRVGTGVTFHSHLKTNGATDLPHVALQELCIYGKLVWCI